jgi:hypothetical protein
MVLNVLSAILDTALITTTVLLLSFLDPYQCIPATTFPNCQECINGPSCSICQPGFYLDFGAGNYFLYFQSTNPVFLALSYPTAHRVRMDQFVSLAQQATLSIS